MDQQEAPTYIEPDVLYSKEEVQRRMGKGKTAMLKAFKGGLKSHKWGNNKYLLGKEVIEWLITQGTESGNAAK